MSEYAYYDIAVVGAGLAGVCAAISAASLPKTRVLLLESASNRFLTQRQHPSMTGRLTRLIRQLRADRVYCDSPELFMQADTGKVRLSRLAKLVRELCYRSYDVEDLASHTCADLCPKTVNSSGIRGFREGLTLEIYLNSESV